MVLRLDPRFPVVWRSPHSLQIGIERPRVVLEALSRGDELVLAALASGISRSGAEMIGRTAGLHEDELRALLATLEPALEPTLEDAADRARGPVVVCGRGETVDRLREILSRSGVTVLADADDSATARLAVIVAHYVVHPEAHGQWLRRDVPHLPIVFGDESVRIGPLVRPGNGPCLHCLDLARTATDDAWPAIASQLWGRRSPADGALVSAEVAAMSARVVVSVGQAPIGASSTDASSTGAWSIELDIATGRVTRTRHVVHPDCGCLSLPGAVPAGAAAPTGSGIGTAAARGHDPTRSPPRTGAAAAAPG